MRRSDSIAADLVKGAIAGAIATWLMNQVTAWIYTYESDDAKQRESEARGGQSALEHAADRVAAAVQVELSDTERGQAASALHYGTGISAGMIYALLRRRTRAITAGGGLAFGVAWFLAIDELMNTTLGLTPGPQEFPWQAHARGLGGHLAFGVANELILEGLDRL